MRISGPSPGETSILRSPKALSPPQGPGKVAICLVRTTGRVGPVSGGRQLGGWCRESDWRLTRTFGPLPRPGAAEAARTAETADTTGRTLGFGEVVPVQRVVHRDLSGAARQVVVFTPRCTSAGI
jgi:hypothetical protein